MTGVLSQGGRGDAPGRREKSDVTRGSLSKFYAPSSDFPRVADATGGRAELK